MALANYTDLQALVANWLHRDDLTAIIPDFIAMAEVRINGDLDARLQDTITALACTPDVDALALPTDVINIRSITVEDAYTVTLDYVTPDQFNTQYPYTDSGVPQVFTIIGTNAYLAPRPDKAYAVNITYKARIPSLISGNNYLMTNYPNVYLYATLVKACQYIKDYTGSEFYHKKYEDAIQTVNAQDWYNGSTLRVRTDARA